MPRTHIWSPALAPKRKPGPDAAAADDDEEEDEEDCEAKRALEGREYWEPAPVPAAELEEEEAGLPWPAGVVGVNVRVSDAPAMASVGMK